MVVTLRRPRWPVRVQATRLGERRSERIERLHRHDRIEQRVQRRRERQVDTCDRSCARHRDGMPAVGEPARERRRVPTGRIAEPQRQHRKVLVDHRTRSVVHFRRGQRLGMQAAGLLQLQSPFVNDAEAQTAADHVQAACRHEQRHGRRPVAGERSLEPLRQSLEGCGQRLIAAPYRNQLRQAGQGADEALGRGDAALRPGMLRQHMGRGRGQEASRAR